MKQRIKPMKAAHFLLIPELLYSPPNDAIIRAYIEEGYEVDVFSPAPIERSTSYGVKVRIHLVVYSWKWIFRNLLNLRWVTYRVISGTSEDPLSVVGIFSYLYRTISICLVDEIKAGSYRGNRSDRWKSLCKWAIRRADIKIVNDQSRIQLLQEYVSQPEMTNVLVYPGCFRDRPERCEIEREKLRKLWGFNKEAFIIGSSGGFNMTAGAEWLISALRRDHGLQSVIQPLGVSDLSLFLLESLGLDNRIYIERRRLSWREAWYSAQGLDIGISIYSNQAPQFQTMGISSNRLCMFIAMGVPVIASKQESFGFLEEFNCGILVESYQDFCQAIQTIRSNHTAMRENCEKCFIEYIRPTSYYNIYLDRIKSLADGHSRI
jgi:glycosyltransferase involved in cell wall biosynthesis